MSRYSLLIAIAACVLLVSILLVLMTPTQATGFLAPRPFQNGAQFQRQVLNREFAQIPAQDNAHKCSSFIDYLGSYSRGEQIARSRSNVGFWEAAMLRGCFAVCVLLWFGGSACAQEQSTNEGTIPPIDSRNLPDNPIPVQPSRQDGPAPCPAGTGKPCALLGGRLYFPDPWHMTEHDKTWWQAARNPGLLVGFALNLASTVADAEGTQACLHAHTCIEGNPLFGKRPTRLRAYGTAVPISLAIYSYDAWLKKTGNGNFVFGALWAWTMAHTYLAVKGFDAAHRQPSTPQDASRQQKLGIAIRF